MFAFIFNHDILTNATIMWREHKLLNKLRKLIFYIMFGFKGKDISTIISMQLYYFLVLHLF